MSPVDDSKFVFFDPHGKRWPRLRLLILVGSVLFFLCAVVFIRALFVTPQIHLPASVAKFRPLLRVLKEPEPPAVTKPLWLRFAKSRAASPLRTAYPSPSTRPDGEPAKEIRLGFYVDWDSASYESARAHAKALTHICPEWITLVDGEGTLEVAEPPRVLPLAAEEGIVVMPLLRNLVGNGWQPEAVEGLANGPQSFQDRHIEELIGHLEDAGAGGVVIDFGQIDPAYRDALTGLFGRMSEALHKKEMELWLCVPVGLELKAFDLEALAPVVDRFVAMLHDENGEEDEPGPIASQDWFEGWLQTLTAYGRPDQWIVSVGAYGYDWSSREPRAEAISFADVMTRASRAGVTGCDSRAPTYNPHFSYTDGGVKHTVWFLDGVTLLNQTSAARARPVGGIAISRLGTEDPSVWEALDLGQLSTLAPSDIDVLNTLPHEAVVSHFGHGEFLTVEDSPADGSRTASIDPSGWAVASYETFPRYITVIHQGNGKEDEVSLSFDDGPDPRWTPAILDILKANGIKASFFLVGMRIEEEPELVARIAAEGHEIGVHTYSHPNLAEISEERTVLELNATQRLIEDVTGRSTILFRPPYNADSRPQDLPEVLAIGRVQKLGYLTVSSAIDTQDWGKPGVEAIVEAVKRSRREGNVVLMHDAGGDRRQTLEALPHIISCLRERGDRFVPLGQLIGQPPEQLMPPVPGNQQPFARLVSAGGFKVLQSAEELLWSFMILATILVLVRTGVIVALAARHHRQNRAAEQGMGFQPPVSILLPAYNEAKVIGRTLRALLDTDYAGALEVLVVDDGSTDRTAEIVSAIAGQDPRVRLLRQPNRGKARALRTGLSEARHEVLVTLDADTHFERSTIRHLVQPLRDERVGAVSGHAKVGNLRSFIARCQSLEYICGFNLDRRAYRQWNCITVTPGAVSALRRSAVSAVGGISTDTLAEDTDLTLSLHRGGFRVEYAHEALAWTEAPETIRALTKQRLRWAFGVLQCLWKHRDLIFDPRTRALGWFSLPGMWFFQILLVAVGPLVDGLLLASWLLGTGAPIYFYLAAFLAVDLLLAGVACLLEGESLRQVWLVLPMRLIYRSVLAWVLWKSIFRAAKGVWVQWGKLERTASLPARA